MRRGYATIPHFLARFIIPLTLKDTEREAIRRDFLSRHGLLTAAEREALKGA